MAEKKSILNEALLDVKKIQEALNANTKEILRSVAKEEINSVVKESLMDEVYDEEDLGAEDELGLSDNTGADALGGPAGGELGGETELGTSSGPDDLGGEEIGIDSLGGIEGSEEGPELGGDAGLGGPELGMDAGALGGAEMDMTAASDDDVIAIYKRMTGDDEIEIVGDEIHMNITEPGQYVVKMDGSSPSGDAGLGADLGGSEELNLDGGDELGADDMGGEESDDVDYEIELDDESGDEESEEDGEEVGGETPAEKPESEEGSEEEEEEEVEELDERITVGNKRDVAARANIGQQTGAGANEKYLKESVKQKQIISETTKKYNNLLTEAMKLKAENEEFRQALKVFRNQLLETVLVNQNLTQVSRLFTDNSTTRSEKESILKRFDEVDSIKESKKLYKLISNELVSRKPVLESIEKKIIKEATTSTSKQLNESNAYVDQSTKRIMDLIHRVEKR